MAAVTKTKTKTPLWLPRDTKSTPVAKFMDYINRKHDLHLRTYEDLHRWSVHPATIATFWREAYIFLELSSSVSISSQTMKEKEVVVGGALDRGNQNQNSQQQQQQQPLLFPPPKFFPSESLNLAEIILRNGDGRDEDIVIHFAREGSGSNIERISWSALRERTRAAYDAMINSGVQPGDRIAAVISNSPDAIVLCLATLAIGAVWSSASCELGVNAVVDRFDQIRPKLIFADDGYVYAGKVIPLGERIAQWSALLLEKRNDDDDGLRNVVVLPYCGGDEASVDMSKIRKGVSWDDFLRRGSGSALAFRYLPFNHPAFILFSSGTTGTPKCIVHSAGGVALKVKTDSQLQHDMRPGDVIFQYTTTAWVMWVLNFVNLSIGVSMLLYDGSPFHPKPDILLQLAEEVGVTVFGTSPRYLAELRSRNILPRSRSKLDQLRVVTSTGSVLTSDMCEWFYKQAFPPHVHLISMSGGTDLAGGLVGGTPLLPVYAGEIQAKCLGMAIDIFDASSSDKDKPVSVEHRGEAGELVCTQPFPSQPLTFYGEGGHEKYRSSYFARFGDGVWCQGDFAQVTLDTKGIVMLGRSDGVLNPSGVRFGSAEIYAVVESFPEIQDSICVGQRREGIDDDEAVLLFVKMKPNHILSSDLINRIKTGIREKYSVRHVPRGIFEVADIPYTINGKKCEINVKQIVSGMKMSVSGTVANPECLKLYERYFYLPKNGRGSGSSGGGKNSKL